jgi:hypothetical protein
MDGEMSGSPRHREQAIVKNAIQEDVVRYSY